MLNKKFFLALTSFFILSTSHTYSQPMSIMNCDTGGFLFSTFSVHDDGRNYHMHMNAGTLFDPDGTLPIIQTLKSGFYNFIIPKKNCIIKGGLMNCLVRETQSNVSLSGKKRSGELYTGIFPITNLQFNVQEVRTKSPITRSDKPDPIMIERIEIVVSLLARHKDESKEDIGAQMKFFQNQCKINF